MTVKLCPVCGVELKPRIVYGIEVDYCPRCGGIWLDGGELQKLVAKIKEYDVEYHRYKPLSEWEEEHYRKRKKRSFFEFIEDLFEFD